MLKKSLFFIATYSLFLSSNLAQAEVTEVTGASFSEKVLQSSKPVVVDVYADWCGPCKRLAPMLSDLSNEMKDQVVFVKLNSDHDKQIADQYNIRGLPTLIFIANGKEVGRSVGLPSSKAELKSKITSTFSK